MLRQVFSNLGVAHLPPPSLDLNFLGGANSIDSRLTTSGGAGGTRVDHTGTVVATSCPRFDYDPVTLACKGLLIEEQRTNIALQSQNFTDATWNKSAVAVTAAATAGPDGATSGAKIAENTATGEHKVTQNFVSLTDNTVYTASVFLKAAERSWARLTIISKDGAFNTQFVNLSTGALGGSSGANFVAASVTAFGGGWYRLQTSANVVTGATTPSLQFNVCTGNFGQNYTGDGVSGIYAFGAQLEAASFATSYIPTTSAQVTRTADSLTMTGTNFSSWFNPAQGTIYAEGDYLNGSGSATFTNEGLYALGDPTIPFSSGQAIYMQRNAATTQLALQVNVGGVNQASLGMGTVSANAQVRVASAYAANDFASSMNGVAPITDISGALPAPTTLSLGSFVAGWTGAQNQMNGHFRRFRYYIPRVPNTTLQQLKP